MYLSSRRTPIALAADNKGTGVRERQAFGFVGRDLLTVNTKTKYLTKSHAAKVWLRKHAQTLGGGWFYVGEPKRGIRIQGRGNVADKLIREGKLKVNCTCEWRKERKFCSTCPAQFVADKSSWPQAYKVPDKVQVMMADGRWKDNEVTELWDDAVLCRGGVLARKSDHIRLGHGK